MRNPDQLSVLCTNQFLSIGKSLSRPGKNIYIFLIQYGTLFIMLIQHMSPYCSEPVALRDLNGRSKHKMSQRDYEVTLPWTVGVKEIYRGH